MMEEVTDCGSSCRIHIFRRVPRAAATCLISARVELPSVHPPPHGLPLAAAAARPGPATSTTLRLLPRPQEIKAQGRVGKLSFQWSRQTRAPCQPTATPVGNTADLLIWAFCGGAGCSGAQGGLGRAETMWVGG